MSTTGSTGTGRTVNKREGCSGGLDTALNLANVGAGFDDRRKHVELVRAGQLAGLRHRVPQVRHPLQFSQPRHMRVPAVSGRRGMPGRDQCPRQVTSRRGMAG